VLVRIYSSPIIFHIYTVKKEQLFSEVKYKKERNGKVFFYVIILITVGVVLLNVANYIVSYT